MLGDILSAVDSSDLAVLTLLDLSAAFDTVDHDTLLRRLSASYGLGGAVTDWFTSTLYFDCRTQYIRCGQFGLKTLPVLFAIPQGSVRGLAYRLAVIIIIIEFAIRFRGVSLLACFLLSTRLCTALALC